MGGFRPPAAPTPPLKKKFWARKIVFRVVKWNGHLSARLVRVTCHKDAAMMGFSGKNESVQIPDWKFEPKISMWPQKSIMRPQYFVFEWLLMTAYLYYIKCYNLLFVISYFGSTGAFKLAVTCCQGPGAAAAAAASGLMHQTKFRNTPPSSCLLVSKVTN